MNDTTALRTNFLAYLESLKFEKRPQELYDPVNYILSIGGKRMRPVLLLMACELFGGDSKKALPAAFSVELFHNFSLLHDDIMDEAPLRRGKPTVHMKYDANTAILSGDVMMIYAYQFLIQGNEHLAVPLLKIFNQSAIDVCEGQQYDMNFETRDDVEISEYLTMIELKTAALLGGSLELGALIGGASKDNARLIAGFGRDVGIAFQLQDDILDSFGDPAKFGKKVGGDIAQNKKTFLLLKALELADAQKEKELERWIATDDNEVAKIKAIKEIYLDLGIPQLAEKLKLDYLEKGMAQLNAISVPKERKKFLRQFAEVLMKREV